MSGESEFLIILPSPAPSALESALARRRSESNQGAYSTGAPRVVSGVFWTGHERGRR
jgi:hypothetical protein